MSLTESTTPATRKASKSTFLSAYIPSIDKIKLPHQNLFHSDEAFYTTEFHALTHFTGHPKRLNRKGIETVNFGSEEYSKEELIAEVGASFLSNMCGITGTLENSAGYIQGWIKVLRNDPRMVVHAARMRRRRCAF